MGERRRAREAHASTMFAQHTIKPEEVHRELLADPGGDRRRRRRAPLRHRSAARLRARPSARIPRRAASRNSQETPRRRCARRSATEPPADYSLEIVRDGSLTWSGRTRSSRRSPRTCSTARSTRLPAHQSPRAARRSAPARSTAARPLLLVRMRFHLTIRARRPTTAALLAEECASPRIRRAPPRPEWLDDSAAEALLAAEPDAQRLLLSRPPPRRRGHRRALPILPPAARRSRRARDELLRDSHRRCAKAPRDRGAVTVEPQLPRTCSAPMSSSPSGD